MLSAAAREKARDDSIRKIYTRTNGIW